MVGLRDYQDAKADVILKYNADEARNLKTYGEIPDSVCFLLFTVLVSKTIRLTFFYYLLFQVKVTDTVNFVDDGMDDDIEFGDDSGDESADDIDDI